MLRIWAEALYDHQDVRISSLNRVRSLIRRRLLELGFKAEKKKKKDSDEEPVWKDEELISLMDSAEKKGLLSEADHDFLEKSFNLAKKENIIEKEYERQLIPMVNKERIYKEWLQYVNGMGIRNVCRLLRYFGYCERFDTISKLWAYSGLHVVEGKSVRRKRGEQLTYNLKVKTGCLGVIGDSLIKANKSYKKRIYDVYKKRIIKRGCCERKHPTKKDKMCRDFPGHAANMARRKMVKVFLSHYWLMCRTIKKLPLRSPFPHKDDNNYIKPFFDKKPTDIG